MHRAQLREHGQDAAVFLVALRDLELVQDVAYLRLHGPLAQHQPLRDAGVRESLGHQLEHPALTLGQPSERSAGTSDERADDHGVERRTALVVFALGASVPQRRLVTEPAAASHPEPAPSPAGLTSR